MGGGSIIGRVNAVFRKSDGTRHLVRHLVDGHSYANAIQEIDNPMIEVSDWLRPERKGPFLATAGARDQAVADKVELDLQDLVADRNRRRAETACGDVERDLPAMIEPGCQHESDLADDL